MSLIESSEFFAAAAQQLCCSYSLCFAGSVLVARGWDCVSAVPACFVNVGLQITFRAYLIDSRSWRCMIRYVRLHNLSFSSVRLVWLLQGLLHAYHFVCFGRGTIARSRIDVILRSCDRKFKCQAVAVWPQANSKFLEPSMSTYWGLRNTLHLTRPPSHPPSSLARRWPLWTEPVKYWRKACLWRA